LKFLKKKDYLVELFRHIETDLGIAVDHPYVIKNNPSIEIQNLPNWILNYLRQKFLKIKYTKKFPDKFYIDRRDAKSNHSHLRKIINETEVKEFLITKGYSIIALTDLSFNEQVNLFSKAEHVVGLHGAGFANLTFCNPGTRVLELKPDGAGSVIENLAKKIQLNYNDISIKPNDFSYNQQGSINIPLSVLEKKIS
jgi:capsular polysaccharide biosynthesis protein